MPRLRPVAIVTLLALGASASTSGGSYTLRWGDTLAKVARKLGVPVDALASINGIANLHRVREGQVLTVPAAGAATAATKGSGAARKAAAPVRSDAVHQVRAGETLSEIARRYGTTVAELARLNKVSRVDLVREGQALVVPAGAAVAPPAKVCPVRGATRYDFSDSWGAPRHDGRRHAGNDIFAARGTEVVAPVGGSLRHVRGSITGLGFLLRGDDGDTYYGAHLDALLVRPGRVEAGGVIGVVGSTGNAVGTPPHLHFEVKPGGGPSVNPYALLRSWC